VTVTGSTPASRIRAWFARWGAVSPLFAAAFTLWLGFGALLPVLPIYLTEHGVDIATLGLVTAAWPAARLVGEPVFGWLADRRSRRRMIIAGLLAEAVFTALPLLLTGPLAFIVLRALAGLATAIEDPAARGHITDATPADRRGEAFGLYSAAGMGGLIFGPAIGALAAGVFGGIGAVFVLCSVASLAAALVIAVGLHDVPARRPAPRIPRSGAAEWTTESPAVAARSELAAGPGESRAPDGAGPAGSLGQAEETPPSSLWNRLMVGAVILHFGLYFAVGVNDVVWSLYLLSRGAGLDLIGLTFATFGLPVLLLSPYAGRIVDRRGSFGALVLGSFAAAFAAFLYPVIVNPVMVLPVILMEGAGTAMIDPALFSVVARGSPVGRASTAQGVFGAAGTVGFIVSSVVAGWLAATDLRSPFYVVTVTILICLGICLVIAGRGIRGTSRTRRGSAVAERRLA
jgi:MFS family permease